MKENWKEENADGTSVKYAGIGIRLYAQVLDFFVLCPILLPHAWIVYYHDRMTYLVLPYYTAFHSLFYVGYRFFFHSMTGQTFGKKWAGIIVVDSENRKIGWRRSFYRILPELFLSLVTILNSVYDSQIYSEHLAEMQGLPWAGVNRILRKFNPIESFAVWDSLLYYVFSILFILLSKKKRALHDLLAGTQVIVYGKKSESDSSSA